jgi:glucosamine kinase
MALSLGMDCGGSSTKVLVLDETGQRVFEGSSGPANWLSTPRESLKAHWEEAMVGCPTVDSAVVAMAGVMGDSDRREAAALFREKFGDCRIRVEPDYVAALAACDHPDAICVISGTGSLVSSWHSNQVVKSGGGGPSIGDWGSGAYTGKCALARLILPGAVFEPKSRLGDAIRATFQCEDLGGAFKMLYSSPSQGRILGELGSKIAQAATDGDEVCDSILSESMAPLADLTIKHMFENGFPERKYKIFRAGGFWDASSLVIKYFEIQARIQTHPILLSPVEGAARLAQQ